MSQSTFIPTPDREVVSRHIGKTAYIDLGDSIITGGEHNQRIASCDEDGLVLLDRDRTRIEYYQILHMEVS